MVCVLSLFGGWCCRSVVWAVLGVSVKGWCSNDKGFLGLGFSVSRMVGLEGVSSKTVAKKGFIKWVSKGGGVLAWYRPRG